MRVALIVDRFEPSAGGVENAAWNTAHGLARAGDEVSVLARRAAPTPAVRRLPAPASASWQPLRVLALLRAAQRRAPRRSFDVVHSFSRTLHQDIYRAGGGSHADYMERRYGPLDRAARRLSPRHALNLEIERRVFADPSQLLQCNSHMVRRQISTRYGVKRERLVVIHNGVDLKLFHPRAADPVRAGGAPVWLFAGSGFRRKGLDTALRALALSAQTGTELWVAGRDAARPWRRLAERLGVGHRVRFLGARADLPDLYRAADGLILPTRYDAFANVCLEAAAAGLAVLTSRANGAAEIFGEGGAIVEDPEDAQSFADELDRLADPRARRAAGEAGRRATEGRSWDAHVCELRALYRRVAALRAPAGEPG